MWRRLGSLAVAVSLLGAAGPAGAQVEVLTPEMAARLVPAKERPLELTPGGDPVRFSGPGGAWQEAAPPLFLDLDKDGLGDYVVFALVELEAGQRAVVIHAWGDRPDVFGPAVFYLIVDAAGEVLEWAGQHRLPPRAAPEPAPPPSAAPPPAGPSSPAPAD